VSIFNRYGSLIYQSTGYSRPWDGSYKGRPLPAGVYYYIIDLKNSTTLLSGSITLIR
jgi:gliding motility-associated-like protein